MWENISVVIPVYNSSKALEELFRRLNDFLKSNFYNHEIIMVDDGSKDNSYEKMRELHSKDKRVKIISLARNYGQQNALMCGFRYSTNKYIVTMDDDLQHRPAEIEKLIRKAEEGYDVVYGISDDNRYQHFYRKLGSKLTNHLFNILTDKKQDIRVSSFRIMNRDILQKVITCDKSFVYISAIIFKYTENIANVRIKHSERRYGASNYTFLKLFKLFCKLYIYYSDCTLLEVFRTKKPQYIIRDAQGIK